LPNSKGGKGNKQAVLKNEIWFKVKEEGKRQPEEYMKYFEDCLFPSDEEIEPYSFFRALAIIQS
jgi:hypothetical protein